jgi:hypothetical protein
MGKVREDLYRGGGARKKIVLFEGSQASSARPSGKSSIKVVRNTSMRKGLPEF